MVSVGCVLFSGVGSSSICVWLSVGLLKFMGSSCLVIVYVRNCVLFGVWIILIIGNCGWVSVLNSGYSV